MPNFLSKARKNEDAMEVYNKTTFEQVMDEALRAVNLWKERALRAETELATLEANSLKRMEELQKEITRQIHAREKNEGKTGTEIVELRAELEQWKEKELIASRAFADEHDKVERLRKKIKKEILNSKGRE